MSLITDLQAADKSGLFTSDNNYVMYSTGIPTLDYANGFWQETYTENGEKILKPQKGLMGGTFTSIIATTGSGKTTLADQIAYSIIRRYKNGLVIHIDAEKTSTMDRILQVTGAKDDGRIILNKSHTSIEDVLQMVKEICDVKQAGGKEYLVEETSYNGGKFLAYVPTVFIIDSLPAFNSIAYATDDLGGMTDGMGAAKATTRFYTNCLDRAWKYNISFIVINHIKPQIDMDRYHSTPKGLLLLKQGEMLPRGQVAQYYSQTYFRLTMTKGESYTLENEGFTGFRCMVEMAKTKTNAIGTTFPIAFLSEIGFDPIYSLFEFAKTIGFVQGKNPYLYFIGMEDFKFNRKDFRKTYMTNENFRIKVNNILRPGLESMLSSKPARSSMNDSSCELGEMEYGTLDIEDRVIKLGEESNVETNTDIKSMLTGKKKKAA